MLKTRSMYIRQELNKNFEAPAQEIVERLLKLGVKIDTQQVYSVRSNMRKEKEAFNAKQAANLAAGRLTREENSLSLGKHIVQILSNHPEGLSDRELVDAVKEAGYTSRASDFFMVVRQKLYDMVASGYIAKNGIQYKLHSVAIPDTSSNSDYNLLRQAVVEYAKAKGMRNPELFPDTLIRQRKEYAKVVDEYHSFFTQVAAE
jgi:hypothetical protein